MRPGHGSQRVFGFFLAGILLLSVSAAAQDLAPPAPQRLVVHSSVLNEDRVIWVRIPRAYEHDKAAYPVVYLMDETGSTNPLA